MKCVNRSHKDFKNLARHYGLSNDQLEVFTHKYWLETGNEDSFPTSVYIRAQLGNFPYQEPSKSVRTLWENKYSEPSEYTSEKEWRNAYNEAKKYFPEYAIVTHKNGKDAFVLSVRKPVANLASEISSTIAYPIIGSKEHFDYKIVTNNIVKETQDNINASAAKRLRNALSKQEQDKQVEYISNETGIDFNDFQMAMEAKKKPTTFTFKDGTTVNSPFLVNQQQKDALNEMNDFVHSDATSMTLSGYAGTGKTSIMQLLAQKMAKENRSIVFSATTNKAASVLKSRVEKAGFDATTLYKAFGFGVEVDSTQDYDANNLIDTIYESNVIHRGDVVVIDEASMINEKIYKQLNDAAQEMGVQIIYLGDKAQLAPVNEDKVSIVFRDPSRKVVELTQVERTGDNAILKEATAIRNGEALSKESSFNAQGEGVAYIPSTDKKGIDEIIQHFVPGLKNDSDYFKILAYTNAAVTRYNEEVRKALGYEDNVPRVGEPIIGYDNWGYLKGRKNTSTYRFINSESYKITNIGETRTVRRSLDNGTPITLQVNDVTIEGPDGNIDTVMMIDVRHNLENRKNAVLLAQEKAKYWALAKRSRGDAAKAYRGVVNEISKFLFVNDNIEDPVRKDKYGRPIVNQKKVYDFGYALTVHKSQGSTFTHVLLDDVDIQRARNKGDLEYGELNFADEGDVLNDAVDAEQAGEMEELFSVEPNDNLIQEAPAETQDESVANIKQQLEYVGMSRATDTVSVIATGVKKADTPLNHIVENPETHTKPVEQMNRRELWDYVGSWAEPMGERPIAYTPKGKEKQQYVVKDGKIYNKKGEEVNYKGKDLNKIFANLAVAEGRGVVVEYREAKYVVDNKQNITSVKSGDIVFKNENDGNRRAIIQEAEKSFRNLLAERQRRSTEITPQVVEYLKALGIPVHNREELIEYLQKNGYNSIQQAIEENREMQEIKAKAQADGTFMKAPNGNRSNLNERQWLQVRTKAFKKWFGDWENYQKLQNATVIWGHPGTGKTWLFKQGRTDIIDFDSEYKAKLGNLQEREALKKKIGKEAYNKKLDELFEQAKEEAIKSGRKLLVSDMHFLRDRSNDLDVVTNISDAEFIERSHQRGEHDEADKMDWKNSINKVMQNIPADKRIDHTGYISDLLNGANVSKIVDENGEPKVVYHGSNTYGFTIFDPTKADDKRSLFFSSSKFIASTYTNFEPLRNNLVRQRLLKNNAVELIKNRNYEALQKLIEETLDYSLPEPGRERNYDPRYNYYIDEEIGKLKKELLKPNLSEEEVLELQADISKLEDMMWFSNNYSLKIRKIPVLGKNGQKEERIELKIDDRHKKDVESSRFIEKGIVFEGTPEQLIEAIQTETKTYSLFLNIKNPLILDNQEGEFGASNNWDRVVYQGKEYKTREISELAQKNGHDGVIFEGIIDHGGYKGDRDLNPVTDQSIAYDYFHEGEDSYTGNNIYSSNVFIAYNPNQVKSATDNIGTFSTENDDIQMYTTSEGEIYGFVDKKGDMYLDETVISSEHPIHEYTHLWDRAVAQRNPELWKRGVALMKQTSLWNEILNDTNYGKKWQAMNGMTDAKLESLIASEVHSRLVGTQGEALLDRIAKEKGSKGIIGKLKQWILDFWKELKGTFSNWSEEEINKLTLDDFNKMTVRDFADGIKLNEQSQQQPSQQQNVPASYEGMITPDANTVFVFGSNPEGRHGAGAAKTAIEKFGAVYGQGEGLQGNSYALPTKDLRVKENRSLRSIPLTQITENIRKMYEVARQNPSKQFKVAYTNGLNEATLNGYTGAEMIKMFKDAGPIPSNVVFNKNWTDHWNEVQTSKQQVKGDNIASGSKGTSELAKKLTNKYNNVSVEYKGTLFKNAEHAYQTWKSGKFDQSGFDANGERGKLPADRATNYQTMVDIITAKLQQHPDLVQGITEKGGMDYLNASTHNVLGKKGDYWETSGQNKFMEALKEAYIKTINQQNNSLNNKVEYGEEFRRIQETSRKLVQKGTPTAYQRGDARIDESTRSTLATTYARLLSQGNGTVLGQWVSVTGKGNQFKVAQVSPSVFHDIFEINRNYLENGELVDLHDNYENTKCYLTEDGLAGFAIEENGNLISVFSLNPESKGGFLYAIKDHVIAEGATHLDAYNSSKQPLRIIYEKVFGAKVASSMDYNMDFDKDNIAENHGNPQVVFMVMGKDAKNSIEERHFNKDQYDEAQEYQLSFLSQTQSENLSPIDALYENNPVYTTDDGIAIPFAPGVRIKYPNTLGGHTFEIDHLVEDGEGYMVRGKHYDRDGKFSHIEEDSIGNIEGTNSLRIFAPDGTDITHYNENPVQEISQEEGTRVSLPNYEFFNDLHEDTLIDAEWKIEMLQELDAELSNENTEEENQDILDQMEEILEATSQDDLHPNLTKKQQQEVETKLTDYDRLNMQIDNLNNSDFISASEVRHAAELIMNAISDEVTKMQKEKGFAEKIFPNLKVDEDFNFQTATRKEIIQTVGIPRLLERAKELFNTEKVDFDDLSIEQEADVIYDNFDGVLHFGTDVFAMNEGFGIKRNYRTNAWEMSDAIEMNLDESGNYQDTATVEEEEDAQQHWQVEQRTLDIISTATELVRMAIHDCYQIDKNGNKVISKWGIAERVNPREAVKQIVRWTRGSQSLPDMISKLKDRETANPWLTQLINRLNDKSGNEADLQSQFYGVMKKSRQSYNITQLENKKYIVNFVNNDISRKKIFRDIVAKYTMKEHPLFEKGINRDLLGYKDKVSKDSPFTLHKAIVELNTINDSLDHNNPFTEEMRKDAVNNIEGACKILGFVPPTGVVENAITKESLSEMTKRLVNIVESLETEAKYQQEHPEEVKKIPYTPFTYKTRHSIDGSLNNFLKPIASVMDDTATNVVIEDGKIYQEEVTPSYLTLLMEKFKLQDRDFRKFIRREYGSSEWFKMKGSGPETGWRFGWLKRMAGDANAREVFDHTVELNFNKHRYMKNMSPAEYAISMIAHYFASDVENTAWFRVPMQSNKPSSEFIRFYAFKEGNYKQAITEEYYNLFLQELSRIQTVNMRNLKKKDADFIKNWDENGKKFNFLPCLNAYLKDSKKPGELLRDESRDKELARLIRAKENLEELSAEDETKLATLVQEAIGNYMQDKADSILDMWERTGIMEAAKSVQGIGETDAEVRDSLENFIWNDNYAAVNILQLTVGDIAAYKDADDLQKRLAELHAPGIRANVFATDYKGNLVSDGRYRTIILKDFDNFISNIVANISEVFDRKIAAAKTAEERKGLEILKDSLVRPRTYNEDGSVKDKGGKYWNINVTDAQGYSSPSSYRKKALMFGKWSRHSEEIYQKLLKGEYDFSDLETAFQPLKPFVYSQLHKDVGVRGEVESPIRTMNIPFQAKNAEYLLIMADALLKGEETSRPNLLRAVYRVMEDSERHNPTRGIDTVQFESAIKSGLQGKLDITQFMNQPGGEAGAYTYMMNRIFLRDNEGHMTKEYNTRTFVHETSYDSYCLQQEVPAHFDNHHQSQGSQERMIIPSDLDLYKDPNGNREDENNKVYYEWNDPDGTHRKEDANTFRREYEETIAANINMSLDDLAEEFQLNTQDRRLRNIALSEILQREILNNPRYGIELFQACSVDKKTGEFRIPKGDPIQAKRIEQLINSMIKTRVNKQEIAGGPIVQVSNFGTSTQLKIRFNHRNGGLLMTREEYEGWQPATHQTYEEYVKENQAGIAYFEVFAPMWMKDKLFKDFADKEGNVDIDAIEMINPDLLKMISYRIPTEDKYSIAPMKIIGFMPKEAGDAIMLPYELTEIDDSDFDVDKRYVMRKEIDIAFRVEPKKNESMSEAINSYVEHNKKSIAKYLEKAVNLQGKTTAKEREAIIKDAESAAELEKRTAKRDHENRLAKIEHRNDVAQDAIQNTKWSKDEEKDFDIYDKKAEKQEKYYDRQIARENERYQVELQKIDQRKEDTISKEIDKLAQRKVRDRIQEFLDVDRLTSSKRDDALTRELRKAYLSFMYRSMEPATGRIANNNKMLDMTWGVLTNEMTADKILNPGGFDNFKSIGYAIAAYKNSNMSWDEIRGKSIDDLKSLSSVGKDLTWVDTQIHYYQQNAAGSNLIGVFAVNKVAHATLEGDRLFIGVSDEKVCGEQPFTIAGFTFGGRMEIDPMYDANGNLVGKTIGSGVSASADTAKEPVLDLMNINMSTAGIFNSMIRLGMPMEDAALFMSQNIIKELLNEFDRQNLSGFASLDSIIAKKLKEYSDAHDFSEDSNINSEPISREELIRGLKPGSDVIDYKVLLAFQNLKNIANVMRNPTFATRFNSISSAVGPQIVDNLVLEYKMEQFNNNADEDGTHIYRMDGTPVDINTIFEMHPILNAFSKGVAVARDMFMDMPAGSTDFRIMLNALAKTVGDKTADKIRKDKQLLSKLSDFYQSYLLVQAGFMNPDEVFNFEGYDSKVDKTKLRRYIEDFPKWFVEQKIQEKYPNNKLIQDIVMQNSRKTGRTFLNVPTTGLKESDKEVYRSAWTDLHKENPELSKMLFTYWFFRGGIGFTPKTAIGLVPNYVKENFTITLENGRKISYLDVFRNMATTVPEVVIDQFIRNNWEESKLVPTKGGQDTHYSYDRVTKEGILEIYNEDDIADLQDVVWMKTKTNNGMTYLWKLKGMNHKGNLEYIRVKPLGDNAEYMEMSTKNILDPMSDTTIDIEDGTPTDKAPNSPVEDEVDNSTPKNPKADAEKSKSISTMAEMIFNYMAGINRPISREAAQMKVDDIKKASNKKQFRPYLLNVLNSQGINVSMDQVLDKFEELNIC